MYYFTTYLPTAKSSAANLSAVTDRVESLKISRGDRHAIYLGIIRLPVHF